jgi:hypothetical protein
LAQTAWEIVSTRRTGVGAGGRNLIALLDVEGDVSYTEGVKSGKSKGAVKMSMIHSSCQNGFQDYHCIIIFMRQCKMRYDSETTISHPIGEITLAFK